MLKNSYWCHKGKHKALNEQLAKLIPDSGEAELPHIELLRCATNIYYDCYNNGGCNMDVRSDQLFAVLSKKDALQPLMKFPKSFMDTQVRLTGLAQGYGRMLNGEDESWMQPLEHVMDAVILYVAKQHGLKVEGD